MSRRDRIRAMIEARSVREDRGYKDPVTGEPSLCRIWKGGTSGKGYQGKKKGRGHSYGRMNLDGATVSVHKAAWVNENGIVPPKKQLGHKCHQRDCSDESHLELCTHLKNQRDKRRKPPLTMDNGGDVPDFRTLRRERPPWGDYNENVPAPDGFDPTNPSDRTYRPPTIIGHDIPADRLSPCKEVTDE